MRASSILRDQLREGTKIIHAERWSALWRAVRCPEAPHGDAGWRPGPDEIPTHPSGNQSWSGWLCL